MTINQTGTIRPITKTRTEYRGDHILPSAWIEDSSTQSWIPPNGTWLYHESILPTRPSTANTPVLVFLTENSGKAFDYTIAHVISGERVYILVPDGWTPPNQPELMKASNVFFRQIDAVPTPAIVTPQMSQLWLTKQWCLKLGQQQSASLRQLFLRLFWHDATREAWIENNKLNWRSSADRPADIPMLRTDAHLRPEPTNAPWSQQLDNTIILLNANQPLPDATPQELWLPPCGDRHEELSTLINQNTAIAWNDFDLPNLVIHNDQNNGEILLNTGNDTLRIRLTTEQTKEISNLLNHNAPWSFDVNIPLKTLAQPHTKAWLPGANTALNITQEQKIVEVGIQAKTLREALNAEPTSWTNPQPLALNVRYEWTVIPPRIPSQSRPAVLVTQWESTDRYWNEQLTKLDQQLTKTHTNMGRIEKTFDRLKGSILGFDRTRKNILNQIEELQAIKPSIVGPEQTLNLLRTLNELQSKTSSLTADIEEAERVEKEKLEREKQQQAWQNNKDEATRDLANQRQILLDTQAELQKLTDELTLIESELLEASKKEAKNLRASQKKFSDELSRAERKIRSCQSKIETHEVTINTPFEYKPSTTQHTITSNVPKNNTANTSKFIPSTPTSSQQHTPPAEALPAVGRLFEVQNKRFLAINTWEELDQGEQEAIRLNAQLVAQENA